MKSIYTKTQAPGFASLYSAGVTLLKDDPQTAHLLVEMSRDGNFPANIKIDGITETPLELTIKLEAVFAKANDWVKEFWKPVWDLSATSRQVKRSDLFALTERILKISRA